MGELWCLRMRNRRHSAAQADYNNNSVNKCFIIRNLSARKQWKDSTLRWFKNYKWRVEIRI